MLKWTILTHRYLGIALGLLVVSWFLSGIAMIYARGMPELTPDARLARMPTLDLARVRLRASEAAGRAGVPATGRAILLTIMGRPAYRIGGAHVFADTGDLVPDVGPAEALAIASGFTGVPATRLHHAEVLTEPDQWTIGHRRVMPLHRIVVEDEAGTEVYVSEQSAEVATLTTRGGRALAWVAAIPHWLYFVELRRRDAAWRRVVLWTAGAGAVLAVLGLTLAVTQSRVRYAGAMRWHYLGGTVFGVFTLTWVFSGWLSMQPYDWSAADIPGLAMRRAFSGGPWDLSRFPAIDAGTWKELFPDGGVKEIEFVGVAGEPYYRVRGAVGEPVLVAPEPLRLRREPFAVDALLARAREGYREAAVASWALLDAYDAYYYSGYYSRGTKRTLPVLRVKYDDPAASWLYVDPRMGQPVAWFTRRQRLERWMYHGLHSLDFPFLYDRRPLWDIVVVVLCLGGAATSGLGLWVGVRRVRRWLSRERR